ncbi:hypothetical protein D3C78_1417690 [compost metagenome]
MGRGREQLLAQRRVAGHAAGGHHHASAGTDALGLAIVQHHSAHHLAVLLDQVVQGRFKTNGNVALAQAVEQAGNQGVTHHQVGATGVAQAVDAIAADNAQGTAQVFQRGKGRQQRVQVGAGHHHAAQPHELWAWRPYAGEIFPQ